MRVYSAMVDTASGYTQRQRCMNGGGCPRLGRLGSGGGKLHRVYWEHRRELEMAVGHRVLVVQDWAND